ncbi:glutamate-5-semialdehyde dehydrogenase [Planctomicrobium piriforme]|uniref:Gamma-glutamyl phosphate reductase n=1 Tax=Planctomicrobium piriforme TaxID=1576369 RepID=A0A1I3P424_9PLAN|nr:glutamate-5-semialdehyde dehydrogenase [Planctomicrobium piriforme]SFJ16284.1 glutamate-5-semialdehyde dehydrogenase [Planctomicrobium piriforme]
MDDLKLYTERVAKQARAASRKLATVRGEQKNAWLRRSAAAIREQSAQLIAANELDISKAPEYGLTDAETDRLRLTPARLAGIASALEEVTALPDPVGEVISSNPRPNGLMVMQVRVPLGVVFFIYESRPNVTADAAALCVKSGNAVILRGGKEALHSNLALYRLLKSTLIECGLPEHAVQLVETTDRAAVGHFLKMHELIDVTIPRGGKSLIERVAAEATMPVIKHFDGVCHVYIDKAADLDMAERILINSKCSRTGVCNAAESFLVHVDVMEKFLPRAGKALQSQQVEIRGDERIRSLIPGALTATEQDYRTEYLDLKISAKVVDSIDEAIAHITEYGSHHTDAIITNDLSAAQKFVQQVDSAAVIVNASTRFNDGGEFGLGAEIGISTDKFHARGPCGLKELTSYKYVAWGDGQVRG